MANELQHADLDLTPDNGAFKLRYVSTETADIAFDANAGTIQAALEAVLGSGNVVVDRPSASLINFEFVGALANANVAELEVITSTVGHALGAASVSEQVTGVDGVHEVHTITIGSPDSGTLVINGVPAASLSDGDIAAAIADAGGANTPCTVSGGVVTYSEFGDISDTLLDFTGTHLAKDFSAFQAKFIISTTQTGGGGSNEIQLINQQGDPFGEYLWLRYDGVEATQLVQNNYDAAGLQAALETIPALTGNVSATDGPIIGGARNTYVEFINSLADTDVPQIQYTWAVIPTVSVTTQGVTPVYEVQRVSLPAGTDIGNVQITGGGSAGTASWSFDSNGATVEAAIGSGLSITVSASAGAGYWDLTFADDGNKDAFADSGSALSQLVAFTFATDRHGSPVPKLFAGSLMMMGCGV